MSGIEKGVSDEQFTALHARIPRIRKVMTGPFAGVRSEIFATREVLASVFNKRSPHDYRQIYYTSELMARDMGLTATEAYVFARYFTTRTIRNRLMEGRWYAEALFRIPISNNQRILQKFRDATEEAEKLEKDRGILV